MFLFTISMAQLIVTNYENMSFAKVLGYVIWGQSVNPPPIL